MQASVAAHCTFGSSNYECVQTLQFSTPEWRREINFKWKKKILRASDLVGDGGVSWSSQALPRDCIYDLQSGI